MTSGDGYIKRKTKNETVTELSMVICSAFDEKVS